MASPTYFIRATGANASIFVRFKISQQKDLRTSTGLKINSEDWSTDKGLPKQNKPANKNLTSSLKTLSIFIEEQYNADLVSGVAFSTEWLKGKINAFFDRDKFLQNDNLFLEYVRNYNAARELSFRTKPTSDRKFIQMQVKMEAFEKKTKKQYFIAEIDRKFMLEFRRFLIEDCRLMESTGNKMLKYIKTVLYDARDNGKTIHQQIGSFRVDNVQAVTIYLTFEEIEKVRNANLIGNDLVHARDWLLIGCYTGQRVSDLLRMHAGMVFTKTDSDGNKFRFIELVQEKTGKQVTIPVHEIVEDILQKYGGNFPPTFGKTQASRDALFNRYIEKVCEIAGISQKVKGRVYNDKTKRYEIAETEKYKLVSSHICRRSFATNFYGDKRFTTPQLMAITGHSTEGTFLLYIGKTSTDHAMQTAKVFREMATEKQKIS